MKTSIFTIFTLCFVVCSLSGVQLCPTEYLVTAPCTYDLGRQWSITEQNYEMWSNNDWSSTLKRQVSYDALGRPDTLFTYNFNSDDDTWYLHDIDIYSYVPGTDYVINCESMYWSGTEFIQIYSATAVYDTQNRISAVYGYSFGNENHLPVPATRQYYVYGTGTTFQMYYWQALPVETRPGGRYYKYDYGFDTQGRIIDCLTMTSPDSTNWVNCEQVSYTYHPNDTMTGADYISLISHNPLNMYLGSMPYKGMVVDYLLLYWHNGAWSNFSRRTCNYDASNKLTEHIIEWCDLGDTEWYFGSKYTYTYDTNDGLMQAVQHIYNTSSSEWNVASRYRYTWAQITSNDDNVAPIAPTLALSVYPNPFRNTLTITPKSNSADRMTYDIYNLKGQMVRTLTAVGNSSLTWDWITLVTPWVPGFTSSELLRAITRPPGSSSN